jgi:HSP20 family protein
MTERSTAVQMAQESTSLKVAEPKTFFDRINRIREGIARRAFEIFESDGRRMGRDLDNWFQAEAEMLHPVCVNITESDEALNIQAEVPGFNANELEVSLEPLRLTISGKHETSKEDKQKGKTIYQEQSSSEILRVIELPLEVNTGKSTATLRNGVLEVSVPKAVQVKANRVEVKAA